ncbi:MAG: hypothetical protein C4547_06445 [Phycisphaerales bacterium]|nr:MAG: hypothetical protein C4547_06445 [Phycisphaerales bacterium]
MVYHGKVTNGIIVLDGQPELPEGASVSVEVTTDEPTLEDDAGKLAKELLDLAGTCETPPSDEDGGESLAEGLLRLAGSAGAGLPADYSAQLDHYLYGVPKR